MFVLVQVDSVKVFLLKYGKDAKGISMLANAIRISSLISSFSVCEKSIN